MRSTPLLLVVVLLTTFTASATEVQRPARAERTQAPLYVGGVALGVAAVSGAFVLGAALSHSGGCAAGAAFGRLLGGGGCSDFIAGPLGVVSLVSLGVAAVSFGLQYALSVAPPERAATLRDSDSRRGVLPPSLQPTGRTDVSLGLSF